MQSKFKLDHNYHGPYRVYEATDTNVKVRPVSSPDAESKAISLQQVSKCKGNFSANQFWCGHNNFITTTLIGSKGKFARNRTIDLEQVGNLMWLIKQHYLYTGHNMEEL